MKKRTIFVALLITVAVISTSFAVLAITDPQDSIFAETETVTPQENELSAEEQQYIKMHDILHKDEFIIKNAAVTEIKTDDELILSIAKQKIFSTTEAELLNNLPEYLLGKTYAQAKELEQYYYNAGKGTKKEECRLYASAIATGKDLAEIKISNLLKACTDDIVETGIYKEELRSFVKDVLTNYIIPLADNGEYDKAIREITTLEEYNTVQRWYITNYGHLEDYLQPDYDALYARIISGESISDIFNLDTEVFATRNSCSQLK